MAINEEYICFDDTNFIILSSPDNTKWKLVVGNDGVLSTEEVTE